LITPSPWGGAKPKNTNSTHPDIVNLDQLNNINDHFAIHTQTYAATATPKASNVNHDDYNNHFAFHTHTFIPTAAATKVQATPVKSTNGDPFATLAMDDFDPSEIKRVCAETHWGLSRDVVINCQGRVGGVGMIYSATYLLSRK